MNQNLFEYILRIGDNSLVLGQRLAEWCGHGPILEEDIAMTNISLDYIGQARAFLTYAGTVEGKNRSEDDLAFLREAREFRNNLLVEQPNGDFAQTMARQLFFSVFQYYFFEQLKKSKDSTLAALADKSFKEVTYHLRHSREWTYRLGDGTEESHLRMQQAIDNLWLFTGDLFTTNTVDDELLKAGVGVDMNTVKKNWEEMIAEILSKAILNKPQSAYFVTGGIDGKHSEHLGHMLSEMQILPRSFPGAEW